MWEGDGKETHMPEDVLQAYLSLPEETREHLNVLILALAKEDGNDTNR